MSKYLAVVGRTAVGIDARRRACARRWTGRDQANRRALDGGIARHLRPQTLIQRHTRRPAWERVVAGMSQVLRTTSRNFLIESRLRAARVLTTWSERTHLI
jgi:hypothetical protein